MTEQYSPAVVIPKNSTLAIVSFIMGLLCLTCVGGLLFALPAIICGIIALVKISGSNGGLKGKGFAITGIVISSLLILVMPILLAILMPALGKVKGIAQRTICGVNLKGLGTAMIVYANDYDGQLPPADQWCDLLITTVDVSPKSLVCPDSDTVEGESSYAMNINAAGKKLDELPADMVLLFETDAGDGDGLRNTPINSRIFYSFIEENDSAWIAQNKDKRVYLNRWNQAGGQEIMSSVHDMGCNIVFVDGHSAYIPSGEFSDLRWTADKP
jgi:prepilin-type processing-associated H-X9-DG protein